KQTLRIDGAKVSHTICPYCAVGCAMLAYTKAQPDGRVELLQLEGDPDSPVNEGRLCPKGASALQLAVSRRRVPSPLPPAADPQPAPPGAGREGVEAGLLGLRTRPARPQHQGLPGPHVRHDRRER